MSVHPGVQLHLSADGVQLGDPIVIWSQAPGVNRYWAQHPGDRDAFMVTVVHSKLAPHPIVKITTEE